MKHMIIILISLTSVSFSQIFPMTISMDFHFDSVLINPGAFDEYKEKSEIDTGDIQFLVNSQTEIGSVLGYNLLGDGHKREEATARMEGMYQPGVPSQGIYPFTYVVIPIWESAPGLPGVACDTFVTLVIHNHFDTSYTVLKSLEVGTEFIFTLTISDVISDCREEGDPFYRRILETAGTAVITRSRTSSSLSIKPRTSNITLIKKSMIYDLLGRKF